MNFNLKIFFMSDVLYKYGWNRRRIRSSWKVTVFGKGVSDGWYSR